MSYWGSPRITLVYHLSCLLTLFRISLFVYKYKQPGNGRLEELDIQAVLPIYGEFSIVMSQMRRETSVLLPTSSTSHLDQLRAGLYSYTVLSRFSMLMNLGLNSFKPQRYAC